MASSDESSSSDDEIDAVKPKRGLRSVLLQYMLYDAFVRPQPWHFAPLYDSDRERVWRKAVSLLCQKQPGAVYVAGCAGELPSVPIYAAASIRDEGLPTRVVHVLEPRRPIASALRSVIGENNLEGAVRLIPSSAGVFRPNPKASVGGFGSCAGVLLVPGLEDIASVGRALESVQDACEHLLASDAAILPSKVSIRAVGVSIPAQTEVVRARVGVVSGFDLGAFNRFRGESPVDLVRLRDVKHSAVTEETELMHASLEVAEVRENKSLLDGIELDLRATVDGELTAIALWTDCTMFDETLSGGLEGKSRRQMVCFLPSPIRASRGSVIKLRVAHDSSSGHFKFSPVDSASPTTTEKAVSMSVERWHFPMVNDERRNKTYDTAIQESTVGCRVIDIGGGTGLLAMMAARAGAKEVVTVERVGDMAECAREVLASNGFAETVRVVHGSSLDLQPEALGFENNARADIVLSEVLDDGLLGEGVIPTVAHARRELAVPGARVIPAAAKVWAQVVHIPFQPEPLVRPAAAAGDAEGGRWAGYDTMRPAQVKNYTSVRLDRVAHVPLTEPFPVFGFDFDADLDDPSSTAEYSREAILNATATTSGTANAVVFWFTLTLNRGGDDSVADICTYPAMAQRCGAKESSRCWNEAVQFVDSVEVKTGSTISLVAAHSPTRVSFRGMCARPGP
jgi:type II protein arginine methyltransferase